MFEASIVIDPLKSETGKPMSFFTLEMAFSAGKPLMSGWFIPFELILIVETSSPVLELFNRIVIDSWDRHCLVQGFEK